MAIPTIQQLKAYYELALQYYTKDHRRMRLLDATDSGDMWKALGAKFPPYQILPDTNHVAYIKANILASIYTVAKCAEINPTSDKDKGIVVNLNIAIDRSWTRGNVGYYQFLAGENAALLNLGITQVGWDETLTGGSGDAFYKGNFTLKNINPLKFMRDPFATSLDTAGYCMIYDTFHKSVFEENPDYAETFKAYYAKKKDSTPSTPQPDNYNAPPKSNAKDYFDLHIYWVKERKKVHEIHVINNEEILTQKEDIKPSVFPFAELYCNQPKGKLVGTSEPAKIFANSVAKNLMDSIALTSEYKNQRPPKFISNGSGLNVQAFNKYGNDADHTFIVNGRADQAVQYHQFPQPSPTLPHMTQALDRAIEQVTGVDGRYTGRDTGSIITTGGTEEMLNRVTLIDTPKIMGYEAYTKRLTHLILANLVHWAPKRKFLYKKPNGRQWDTIEVDFPQIDNDTLFEYEINISSMLPKNKARIAAMANMLMEKQMQYRAEGGGGVTLITEEEWLMFQDLPMKEFMLERMGIERMNSAVEDVSQILFGYADLVKNGMSPDDAILATANGLEQKRKGQMPPEGPMPAVNQAMMQPPMPGAGGVPPGM